MRRIVFLLDVDNTLLDNDRVVADLRRHLTTELGAEPAKRYFAIFEALRNELGYADYLGALQRYRLECPSEPKILEVSSFLLGYPFADRLFPGSIDVVRRFAGWGTPVVLSDGDVVFQPHKIERSGIGAAVGKRVLIYVHKEKELADVAARYPADHYVFVDDKLRLLTAFKEAWGARVTTVFPRQGHYARDPDISKKYPAADLTVDGIGDLLSLEFSAFVPA